jgi:hypothetical protein
MTDFIARLGEFRFAIINSQISTAQALPALKNILHLREKLMILEPQVAIGQRFECQKITKRKIDMNINEQAHAIYFSVRNQSRSSTSMIDLLIVCNKKNSY